MFETLGLKTFQMNFDILNFNKKRTTFILE